MWSEVYFYDRQLAQFFLRQLYGFFRSLFLLRFGNSMSAAQSDGNLLRTKQPKIVPENGEKRRKLWTRHHRQRGSTKKRKDECLWEIYDATRSMREKLDLLVSRCQAANSSAPSAATVPCCRLTCPRSPQHTRWRLNLCIDEDDEEMPFSIHGVVFSFVDDKEKCFSPSQRRRRPDVCCHRSWTRVSSQFFFAF